MKGNNLRATVTNILNKVVTEEEARIFASEQFGVLCAHIRAKQIEEVMKYKEQSLISKN